MVLWQEQMQMTEVMHEHDRRDEQLETTDNHKLLKDAPDATARTSETSSSEGWSGAAKRQAFTENIRYLDFNLFRFIYCKAEKEKKLNKHQVHLQHLRGWAEV